MNPYSAVRYVLCDIEGTTTSIAFVYQTLFPYFLAHFDQVQAAQDQAWVQAELARVRATVLEEENRQIDDQEALAYLCQWVNQDRKHPALKSLQGQIWEQGYRSGQLKGHLYPDVPTNFQAWRARGLEIGIYSSGSVAAQRLLFGHSDYGDLCPLLSHYFDTAVGSKREASSYAQILAHIAYGPEEVLFLSDVPAELAAAHSLGLRVVQLLRPDVQPDATWPQAKDFDQVSQLLGI